MLGSPHTDGVDEVRDLARQGLLATTIAGASGPRRSQLTGATYSIAWPVVYQRLTRKIELRRGHVNCAASVRHLAAECLDRFENDVEAVVDDVARKASARIENLEGWIASRLIPATVDAHRRRRGEHGALQRPRVPAWLAKELGGEPWLLDLATQILVWAGTPATAGYELWPTESWVVRRCERHGGWSTYGETDLQTDIRTVLHAMSSRPQWYEQYVEGPLGHKQAPLASSALLDDRGDVPVDAEAENERLLTALADGAVQLIRVRLARGEAAATVVAEVIDTVFGADVSGGHLGRAYDDRLERVLRDSSELDRIVATVLDIIDIGRSR
ncbi:hypothetical protein ACGFI5_04255 [Micromonospora tulbaghiae]|uniref:Uncharacterized protein n=1 Tax=Micromonospora tulbaghiae TaxID=479978 RepID=A0ABY0KFI4_9ACTN|nr:hypothetical protein [Micromonospora tulbaghiae]MDX5460295.1 hypothetical protein [Micromonospora tulbaghiae]SCE65908.1 hypothetical protein GA0070562_1408 [Micromonospora tulbaghiae]